MVVLSYLSNTNKYTFDSHNVYYVKLFKLLLEAIWRAHIHRFQISPCARFAWWRILGWTTWHPTTAS